MPAPKGNQFWRMRSSHGRKPIFSDPQQLWDACEEYFTWCEEHPLWEAKAFPFQGEVTIEYLPKIRAMTIGALCLFLDIDHQTWQEYKKREDFFAIVTRAEQTIRAQKFEGAAAELLNPNIIARDLGLRDKQEFVGRDDGPIQIDSRESTLETAKRLAYLLTTAAESEELDHALDQERQEDHGGDAKTIR
jgi:hypothetical protein